MKLKHAFLVLCLMFFSLATAQVQQLQSFVRNMEAFNRVFPQEKVYLHLDNSGYFIGEKIWYKAYLTHTYPQREHKSRVLYVELIDPFGEVVETQRLHLQNDQAEGQFSLNRLRTSGFYEVRAYTRYMTNFDTRGIFSRVLPLFERPQKDGNYTTRRINEDFVDARQPLSSTPQPLDKEEKRLWRNTASPTVHFYPEGGALVKGLTSVVAFDVACADSLIERAEGYLLAANGDTLLSSKTFADGRGYFLYTPTDEESATFVVYVGGQWHRFPLPKAETTGAVMTVQATSAHYIAVQVQGSEDMNGRQLGLSLLHNGQVEAFDTLQISSEGYYTSFQRNELSAGVHQLTLFDAEGRIWAERLFFVAPDTTDGIERIAISTSSSMLQPFGAVTMNLKTKPRSTFSLSVLDATTTTNLYEGNIATYLLLSSEVKGFVRHAESYLKNDAFTRHRADLLMLTQAWRRYNWQMMAGKKPFVKQQPLEDTLYIDGRLRPQQLWGNGLLASKKAKARANNLGGIDLRLTLYNQNGEHFSGDVTTDTSGYYAFAVPPIEGDWTLVFSTRLDNQLKSYPVSINRWFSPQVRNYSPFETELIALADTFPQFNRPQPTKFQAEVTNAQEEDKTKSFGAAVIVRKRVYDYNREAWETTRQRANARSQYRFNLEREAERCLDEGKELPTLSAWLMSKNAFAREFYGRRRAMGVLINDNEKAEYYLASKTTQRRFLNNENFNKDFMKDTAEVNNNIANFFRQRSSNGENLSEPLGSELISATSEDRSQESFIGGGTSSARFREFNIGMGSTIDQVREVYVALQDSIINYFTEDTPSIFKDAKPFHVFVYPRYRFNTPVKGFRRTTFQGFNAIETFESPNYATLPPSTDFRRTLYWNPNVTTDSNGTAVVQFYNNQTATSLLISAEGLTSEGVPILGN